MQQEIEKYLERIKHYGYNQEQLEAVKEFRESAELFPKEQFDFLVEQKVLKRTRKLKKIRNMYFKDDKIWILNHYFKKYEFIARFYSDEEISARRFKEEEEEKAKLERKRLKAERKKLKKLNK